jgi:hypothetical protein
LNLTQEEPNPRRTQAQAKKTKKKFDFFSGNFYFLLFIDEKKMLNN